MKSKNLYLEWRNDDRVLQVIPWGEGLRVRETKNKFSENNWALTEDVDVDDFELKYSDDVSYIRNGSVKATVDHFGKIVFYDLNEHLLLEEYWRIRRHSLPNQQDQNDFIDSNMVNQFVSALKVEGRELTPKTGGDYFATVRFESQDNEHIYGMGQYQQSQLDLKYCTLELAQRNSQTTVPFMMSSKGYGFLWNNPAIGRVTFAKNITEWTAIDTNEIDYWICCGQTPKEITEKYVQVTGRPSMMPDYGLGLWQSKMRYQTQEELLEVARSYYNQNIPLSVIVIDFFHWTKQGDFKFDSKYWPDPESMVGELKSMGIELMVSVWPNIDERSENYDEMLEKGYLIRSDKGSRVSMKFQGNSIFFDATNFEARNYVWSKVKNHYYKYGIKIFWLDEAEPEYSPYDFDLYRLKIGRNTSVGNIYPKMLAKGFFENMKNEGQDKVVNLIRSAWAGSQKYGALVWSGDIDSSFRSLRNQYQAGLNMGIAGIPWWTTDIGGFHGGVIDDPKFKECLIRWFEYATFCPVLRMHGDREPHENPLDSSSVASGAANEVWSYGEETLNILRKFITIRENIKPYIKDLYQEAHRYGYPLIRTLYYEFPKDTNSVNVSDEHMFGSDILVAPIFDFGIRKRDVYLPTFSEWINIWTKEEFSGGQVIEVDAPLDRIPIFVKKDAELSRKLNLFTI
ncbi:glycoside hydrolase family 31 protein [Xylocopilactobacillus apis]|uniref:glycoside hydrolase family 31 protein n=1 Tax=Xylocopilactobacillus apis TaxID=2932183 RepID=UPI002952DB14|nr:TIM-barrel domain-containing protein [Xylocopilactobacillus apis]